MSYLKVTGLSHSYGGKVLYKDASFTLYKGEHMGVVGLNGAGKSTLVGILTGSIIPDEGTIIWQPHIKTGCLDQQAADGGGLTVLEYLKTAYTPLYMLEQRVQGLYEQYALTGREEYFTQASDGQAKLEAQDFYSADLKTDKVINGLGLSVYGLDTPLKNLSGGQRAKVILAKLLLEEPDVLLLDEPTNFLDKEHVQWLAGFLNAFENAFIVVSHDFDFLEQISNCICDVEAQALRKYHGKYSDFLKQKEHMRADHIRRYNAQQQMIRRTEEYIRKNIAGNNSKNAKGRRKQLEHIARIAPPAFTAKPSFRFPEIPLPPQKALVAQGLSIGYKSPLLPPLDFTVQAGEKLVITGFNGIGKSTLLKTLMGKIPALSGSFTFSVQAVTGYYEQELYWPDAGRTPAQIISAAFPALSDKQIRRFLAGCGVKNDSVTQAVHTLSGGEQAKVKLCLLLIRPCNFLILDEPGNHLDADTKDELLCALQSFSGSVILVSHEERFYKRWADRVLKISSGRSGQASRTGGF